MVIILKLMFFLVILQLTLASTVYSKNLDDGTTNTGSEEIVGTAIAAGNDGTTIAAGNEDIIDTTITAGSDENDGTTNTGNEDIVGNDENDDTTNAGSNENNQVFNQNTLMIVLGKAVPGTVTPDASCGDAIFDRIFVDSYMGEDGTIVHNTYGNLIAMAPEAEWNQDAIKNCDATKIIYCKQSESSRCKYTEVGRSSVPVRIVGSTGPNGEPNKYILHPTPFSAIADPNASEVDILAALSSH